jgi:hypothetical protein
MNLTSTGLKFACAECGERIPVRDLEERFLDDITSYLRSRQHLAAEAVLEDRPLADQRAALRDAEQRAEKLDAEMASVERLFIDKLIPLERFEGRYRPLEDQRRAISESSDGSKRNSQELSRTKQRRISSHVVSIQTLYVIDGLQFRRRSSVKLLTSSSGKLLSLARNLSSRIPSEIPR